MFNPSRLVLGLKSRGVTKQELADAAGISTRSLAFYETGEKTPTPETLARLADALRQPVEFFSAGDLREPPQDAISFRALSTLSARERDRAIASATFALALADWVRARFRLPAPTVPELRGVAPETAAEMVRREWGLGELPIHNMVHLLEAHGVTVFSLIEERRELDGFSFWDQGQPYVFLDTTKSAERTRMDAAHELGHLVLHGSHEVFRGREIERDAQVFGAAFLMPRGSMLAYAPRNARVSEVLKAKRYWNVAAISLAYRMYAVGLLTEWQHRMLMAEMSHRGYRTNEPKGSTPEFSQVLAKIFTLLRERSISLHTIAQELAVSVDALRTAVFGLILTPLDGDASGAATTTKPAPDLRLIHTACCES